jgi:hypothetical protein
MRREDTNSVTASTLETHFLGTIVYLTHWFCSFAPATAAVPSLAYMQVLCKRLFGLEPTYPACIRRIFVASRIW